LDLLKGNLSIPCIGFSAVIAYFTIAPIMYLLSIPCIGFVKVEEGGGER